METQEIAKDLAKRGAKWKLARAIPVLGIVFSAMFVVHKIRTKGARRGGVDAALDMTPVVGRLKAVYEFFRGDIIQPRSDLDAGASAAS
ncbi:MAG: hypothetical protein M3Y87_22735 [Myxococcota bacterium]|nr:hypothetical protein [Myxococcota bacterium]